MTEEDDLKVLLADDDALLRKVTSLALKRLGVTCDAVPNGAEAVELWRARRHGLVLLDVEMPELRGPDVARVIRAEQGDDRPYLVALTGHEDGRELQGALDAGMDQALSKPVRADQLATVIASARRGSNDGLPVLDRSSLEKLAELSGDPSIIRDLIDMFRDDAPTRVEAIRKATTADELARAAHAFKSGSGTLGAKALHHACKELEALGRTGELAQREALTVRMLEALDALMAELDGWCPS